MSEYTKNDVNIWIDNINNGTMKPNQLVPGTYSDVTMLQALLQIKIPVQIKYKLVKQLIDLGCSVDQFASGSTPLAQACIGNANEDDYKNIVLMMLQHHEKGHMSDYRILKSCTISFDDQMFNTVLKSQKVDTNVTINRGTHILHTLAEDGYLAYNLYTIFKDSPETIPNPINRHGLSPLAIAINKVNSDGAMALWRNKETKIIGKIERPDIVVAYDMIDRYDGNFFIDFPDMIEYIIKKGKTNMLPKELDIFLF